MTLQKRKNSVTMSMNAKIADTSGKLSGNEFDVIDKVLAEAFSRNQSVFEFEKALAE